MMALFESEPRDVFHEPITGTSTNGLHLQLRWYVGLQGLVGEAEVSYPDERGVIETWQIVLFGPQIAARVMDVIRYAQEKLGK